MSERLKDRFFNRDYYNTLASAIQPDYPAFDAEGFLNQIFDDVWEDRALMDKMRYTTQTLAAYLPTEYRSALGILFSAAPKMTAYVYENLIFSEFVAMFGLEDWDASLPAFERFTQLVSAEFAVRPFIVQDAPRMMAQMLAWADHPHEQVRRLASEGCRPLLPWGIVLQDLKADPTPILPILEKLKADPVETVRRSVANNLNDIAKNQPDVVTETAKRWSQTDDSGTQWIIRHALRTLIKRGNPAALAVIGYPTGGEFEILNLTVAPVDVPMGGELTLSFTLESKSESVQNVMVDYIVYFVRANGKQNAKVFKLSKGVLPPYERIDFRKGHSFRPITTRRYYVGTHAIEIQVNGVVYGRMEFELLPTEYVN
jgi:3-methyladenine DNA glycosylase AlkC